MFRLKLTLLYFFTIVLVVVAMWALMDSQRDAFVQEQLYPSLKSAASSYRVLSERRVFKLKEYAASMLRSDLPTYMQFLEKNKEGIRDLRTKTRQAFPVRAKVPPERIISFVNQEAKGLLTKFYETIEKKVLRKIRVEGGYAQYMTDMFGSCLAEGDPWAVCYFKLTYFPLTRIIFPEQKAELGDAFPELFILVDAKKTTRLLFDKLDTSVAKLQREDLFMAGVGFRNHVIENFDQSAEVLKQLRSSFEPMISSYLTINDRVFVVVASRIEAVDGQYLGALLVGHELGKGLAWQDTAVTLGIRPVLEQCIEDTKAEADAANLTSDKLCEYEMSLQEKASPTSTRTGKDSSSAPAPA